MTTAKSPASVLLAQATVIAIKLKGDPTCQEVLKKHGEIKFIVAMDDGARTLKLKQSTIDNMTTEILRDFLVAEMKKGPAP